MKDRTPLLSKSLAFVIFKGLTIYHNCLEESVILQIHRLSSAELREQLMTKLAILKKQGHFDQKQSRVQRNRRASLAK